MERPPTQQWLLAYLANGPRLSSDLYRAADAAGYTKKAVRRARRSLGDDITITELSCDWSWAHTPRQADLLRPSCPPTRAEPAPPVLALVPSTVTLPPDQWLASRLASHRPAALADLSQQSGFSIATLRAARAALKRRGVLLTTDRRHPVEIWHLNRKQPPRQALAWSA